ncbi:MAG TPA: MoxR family ATPase [Methanoregulaceae archaeon]|nr:MoxR family ATPase [Methanoregulaceae archaeon]
MTDEKNDLALLGDTYKSILDSTGEFIVGNERLIELCMIGLLSGGHLLIEGTPGTGKTSIVKALAKLAGCSFSRFQCAVDSQPADILGIRIYDPEIREFALIKGPIFTNFLLIDEINRLAPKTQSAFIEAMSESQATIDGITSPIDPPFTVIATQNPFEYEGTFPLIEAQKDRFMFSISISQLDDEGEMEIIKREHSGRLDWDRYYENLAPVMNSQLISRFIAAVQQVYVDENLLSFIRDLVMATRKHGDIHFGASSRASIALVRGSKAFAALKNRTYVIPDDIKWLAPKVLHHRIILEKEAELSDITSSQVISGILDTIEVP